MKDLLASLWEPAMEFQVRLALRGSSPELSSVNPSAQATMPTLAGQVKFKVNGHMDTRTAEVTEAPVPVDQLIVTLFPVVREHIDSRTAEVT
jgi:hypothetical protein